MAKVTIKATITDIDVNPKLKKAIIAVALTDGTNNWTKAIGIDLIDSVIDWETFKSRLAEMTTEDMNADIALSEIRKRKGHEFNLMDVNK